MHDLSYFREHLDLFADMAKRRGTVLDLDAFRILDKERRELITKNEQRKAQRNKASEEIARLKKEKQPADAIIAEEKSSPTGNAPRSAAAAATRPGPQARSNTCMPALTRAASSKSSIKPAVACAKVAV